MRRGLSATLIALALSACSDPPVDPAGHDQSNTDEAVTTVAGGPMFASSSCTNVTRPSNSLFAKRFNCNTTIRVTRSGDATAAHVTSAIAIWNDVLVAGMPRFVTTGGDAFISVRNENTNNTGTGSTYWYCGSTTEDGLTIRISKAKTKSNCGLASDGSGTSFSHAVEFGDMPSLIAHELGHSLGFAKHFDLVVTGLETTPVYHCVFTLPITPGTPGNDRLNWSACQHEVQILNYFYGLRDAETTEGFLSKHVLTGFSFTPSTLALTVGGSQPATLTTLQFDRAAPSLAVPAIATVPVNWTSENAAIATVASSGTTRNVTGVATGATGIGFAYAGTAYDVAQPFGPKRIAVTVSPAVLTRVITSVAGGTSGTPGTALNPAPKVKVTQNGVAVSGATLTFTVTAGNGTVSPASAVTNASGEATTAWTLGATPGVNTLKVSTANAADLTLSATGNAPLPTVNSFAFYDCSNYVATNSKTYNTFTLNWTLSAAPDTSVKYEIGENTTNNSATATVVQFGVANAGYTTLGDAAPLAGPYLKGTSSNLRYWWVRVKNTTTTGPWRALAAPKFPMETKTCVPPI